MFRTVYDSTSRRKCAVLNMAVSCSSLTLCFPGMFAQEILTDFRMIPVAPIITGNTFVFTFHMRCTSVVTLCILEYSRILS